MTKPDLTDDDYTDLAGLVRKAIDAKPSSPGLGAAVERGSDHH
jgi:hypothetical protein